MNNGLLVNTRSVVLHDDGTIEVVYQEERDDQNGVRMTRMLQFQGDVYPARVIAFLQDCQDFVDDMLVVQREGAPK